MRSDALLSIGIYSLENVIANLQHLGYHQAQIDAVRRNWLAFKAAQVRVNLERSPVEGVVAMSGWRR